MGAGAWSKTQKNHHKTTQEKLLKRADYRLLRL